MPERLHGLCGTRVRPVSAAPLAVPCTVTAYARCTALPRRRPGFGGAGLQRRDDIDHDRSVGGDRLLEGRRDLPRLLDADTAHAEAAGDLGKIGRSKTDQGLAAVRPLARN